MLQNVIGHLTGCIVAMKKKGENSFIRGKELSSANNLTLTQISQLSQQTCQRAATATHFTCQQRLNRHLTGEWHPIGATTLEVPKYLWVTSLLKGFQCIVTLHWLLHISEVIAFAFERGIFVSGLVLGPLEVNPTAVCSGTFALSTRLQAL